MDEIEEREEVERVRVEESEVKVLVRVRSTSACCSTSQRAVERAKIRETYGGQDSLRLNERTFRTTRGNRDWRSRGNCSIRFDRKVGIEVSSCSR